LNADRTEPKNLAAAQRAKVNKLAANWGGWAQRARVLPGPARFSGDGTETVPGDEATPQAPAKAGARKKRAGN
jgi:hypothetical protein